MDISSNSLALLKVEALYFHVDNVLSGCAVTLFVLKFSSNTETELNLALVE